MSINITFHKKLYLLCNYFN